MKWLVAFFLLLSCISADAANRFATCATTCTWDASSTAMWGTASGGTGASVPGSGDAVILDGATCVGGTTCTITVNTNPTVQSLTMGACTASTTGCILDFSVNNNSPTFNTNGVSITGSGTRTLKMGSGTFTISGNSGVWDATTVTNLTLTQGTSTIAFTAGATGNNRTMAGGGKTYATISVGANTGAGAFTFTDTGNTFGTVTLTAPNWVRFSIFTTNTITNAITWTGTTTKQLLISSDSVAISPTINSAANAAMQWVGIYRITMGGGGTHAATNSFNFHNNSGITITAPTSIGSSQVCILGGWLLWRDMPDHLNDNFPAWLEKAA